jgi:hypothetical protein
MGTSSLLLLPLLIGAASADVNVRFTAGSSSAVTSTSYSSCASGAYRAKALAAAAGLRLDGGGVAAKCGTDAKCAEVFAAMGYDGWALNADDLDTVLLPTSSLEAFIDNVGSKPVLSNYASSYTSTFANIGGAVLLAVADGGTTTYRQAITVALADARDAGIDFETTPVILCVSGMSSTDITDLGASNAEDAVQKLAYEMTDVDLVIATSTSSSPLGFTTSSYYTATNWAGDQVYMVAPASASSQVEIMELGFDNDGTGAPSSMDRDDEPCSSSNYDEFIYKMINNELDIVEIGMLCDTGAAAREECDAGRAAFEAINNKNDGILDDLLTSTKLEVTVATFVGDNCGETLGASARTAWQTDLAAANPVAVVGPGGTTCAKSVASPDARSSLAAFAAHATNAVVISESSTATSASDRSKYPNLVRLASTEDTVSQGVLAVIQKYGWARVAIVYDATDSWAADTARVLSENLGNAGIAVLGDKCVSRSCTTSESKSDHDGPRSAIRFDKADPHWGNTLMTTDVADSILDELVALDAKIIYLMITPSDTKVLFERIYQTKKCFGAGHAYFTGWASDDIFLEADGSASTDAAYGAQGLLTIKERVDTSGSLAQALIAHREAGMDKETCAGDDHIAGEYCDNDDDATSLAGYGPQVVDSVITLAKALHSFGTGDTADNKRQNPDEIYKAIGDVGRAGFEGYSGNVVLDYYNERVGSMEVRNYQLKEKAITGQRRLAVDLTSTALADEVVANIVGGQFVPTAGTEIIFPGGTTKVPLDRTPEDGDEKGKVDMGLVIGLCVAFGLIMLGALFGFYRYRQKKIAKSRKQKATIQQAQDELQAFKESVVNMRVVVEAAAPGGSAASNAPPAAPAKWYWEESVARLTAHAVVKPPHWIPYDDQTSAQLEAARAKASVGGLPVVPLSAAYHANVLEMKQTNVRTGFSRALLRDAPLPPKSSSSWFGSRDAAAPPPPLPADIDADERICLVCDVGAILQLAKQRDDGWAFGSVVLAADGALSTDPGYGWNRNQGWFQMEKTDVPTADQLAELQKVLGGSGGTDALATPKYWDDVKDPTVVEYFRLDPRSPATRDEYTRCVDAFMLTLDRSKFRIHSVDRVQNISLWQSYAVKKAATCSREDDPDKAARKYVRAWLFHGCPSDVVPKILQQGFNRSFCGKNATLYGKGVYFARDASYSTFPLYCAPDAQGVQTIFLVRAVVGQWSKGVKDALTPDVRDAARNILYDCTVDNVKDPSIFVTYHDAQAYPEYMIKFSQTTQHTGDPLCGNQPVS